MIAWNEIEPDIKVGCLADVLSTLDCLSAINVVVKSIREPLIYIAENTLTEITTHLRESNHELGGLLFGKAYQLPFSTDCAYSHITMIDSSLPSKDFRNSAVSLQMGTKIWEDVGNRIDKGSLVIGWYHSHPNLGAFFSGTDRATQAAFFNLPYSVGLVMDPFRNDIACFLGPDSAKLKKRIQVTQGGFKTI